MKEQDYIYFVKTVPLVKDMVGLLKYVKRRESKDK